MRFRWELGIGLCLFLAQPVTAAPLRVAPLRVAIAQEVNNLTPYSPGIPETLLDLVYDRLASPSPYLANATPWLATAIVPEGQDGRSWRIDLRDGIHWHDGVPFTANDVVFTFRYYRSGVSNRWTHHVSDTPKLTTIEPLGRLSLRVQCERPCPSFDKVTAADLVILPEHLWKSVTQPNLYRGPVIGTGPYRFAEMAPGRFIRLEANPGYFAGTPRVKSIIITFIRNPATAFAALCADELDLVVAPVPPELVASLSRRRGLAVREGGNKPLNAVEMRLNFDRLPMSDNAFRRAIALAIRQEEILQRVALGQGVAGGFPAPASPWTKPGLRQPGDDPAAAVAILNAKGFRDRDGDGFREDASGARLRLSVKVSSNEPVHQRAAQVVVRQLKAVGLEARIEVVDQAQARALYSSRKFDLLVAEVTPHSMADPDQYIQSIKTGYLWRDGKSYPALEALIGKWWLASTEQARIQAGYALQQLLNEAPATLMLYYPKAYFAYRPKALDHWKVIPGMGVFHKWSLVEFFDTPVWARQ